MKNLTWPHLLVTELMAYLVPIGEVGWSWVEVGVLGIENESELQRQKMIRKTANQSNLCQQNAEEWSGQKCRHLKLVCRPVLQSIAAIPPAPWTVLNIPLYPNKHSVGNSSAKKWKRPMYKLEASKFKPPKCIHWVCPP